MIPNVTLLPGNNTQGITSHHDTHNNHNNPSIRISPESLSEIEHRPRTGQSRVETINRMVEEVDTPVGENAEDKAERGSCPDHVPEQHYPEGGFGWIVLTATVVISFWCIGITFCWGVLQEYFLRNNTFPGADAKQLSWVGSIACSSIFIAAPGIVIFVNRFGAQVVQSLGVACVVSGFIGGSFVTQYWHMYITLGFLFGFGGCIVYFTAIWVLSQYFHKKRGLAVGLVVSGAGIGATIMAPCLRIMLTDVGFRWSLRILGACMLFSLAIAICFIKPYERPILAPSADSAEEDIALSALPQETAPASPMAAGLDFKIFCRWDYTLIFITALVFTLVYLVPILLAPSYAISIGLEPVEGATMVSINSAVGIVSRILIGHWADQWGVLNMTILCTLLTGLSCLIFWQLAKGLAMMIIFMVCYGAFAGSALVLLPVAATRAADASHISSALGFVFFAQAAGYLFGTPLAQFIIDSENGGYEGAIVLVGVSNLICCLITVVTRVHVDSRLWIAA